MSEKCSQIELRAIQRKRGEFVHRLYERIQPIVSEFAGMENSGTVANKVAEMALSEVKTRLDAKALDELDDMVRLMGELMQERKDAE